MDTIIHIGYPKNASTWFRTQYFPNIDNIDYIAKPIIREQFLELNTFSFKPDEVKNYFNKNYSKRLLLSHENLVGSIRSGGFNGIATKEFGERLKSVFPDANIIIFIRNQADVIASAYIQNMKQGGTDSINSYLYHKDRNLFNNMMMFSFTYFEYDKIIKYYNELFGKDKVHVFLFEEFNYDKINFLKKFTSAFNFNIDINKLDMSKKNTKLRKGLIPFIKTANIFTKKNTVFKYYLLNIPYCYRISRILIDRLDKYKIFGNTPSTIATLGKKNYDFINSYYRSSNNKLVKDLGISDIEKYNYPL